jgi:SAM-dependent methyltransferase
MRRRRLARDGSETAVCAWTGAQVESEAEFLADRLGLDAAALSRMAVWFRNTPAEPFAFRGDARPGDVANIAFVRDRGRFERLALGGSFWLYEGPFAEAFLRHCGRLLAPGGTLMLYKRRSGKEVLASSMRLDWAASLPGLRLDGEDRAFWHLVSDGPGPEPEPEPQSVYDWYRARGRAVAEVLADPSAPYRERRLDELDLFAAGEDRFRAPLGDGDGGGDVELPAEELQRLENAGVLVGRKAPYMEAILADLGDDSGIDLFDHGTATAAIPMELLLSRRIHVRSITALEPGSGNWDVLADSYLHLRDSFRGSLTVVRAPSDDWEYDRPYDAISFLGSLFHVPRPAASAVLDRAWEALRPGGALVVLESVRELGRSLPSTYSAKVFGLEELEALLARYGEVVRYHPTELRPCTRKETGAQRVFRVVRKP